MSVQKKKQRVEISADFPAEIWTLVCEFVQTNQCFNSLYRLNKNLHSDPWKVVVEHFNFKLKLEYKRDKSLMRSLRSSDISYVSSLDVCEIESVETILDQKEAKIFTELQYMMTIPKLKLNCPSILSHHHLKFLDNVVNLTLAQCSDIDSEGDSEEIGLNCAPSFCFGIVLCTFLMMMG